MKNKNILWLILLIILYIVAMFVIYYILNINPLLLSIFSLIMVSIICLYLYKKKSKDKTIKSKLYFSIPSLFCFIITIILLFSGSQLNYVEEQVFDRIINLTENNDFFNPKEARLLDVIVKYKYSDTDREYVDTVDYYYVKILGTNKVGGTINNCYQIYYSNYESDWDDSKKNCEDIYKSGLGYEQLSTKSIKNINKAIQRHWENLGL